MNEENFYLSENMPLNKLDKTAVESRGLSAVNNIPLWLGEDFLSRENKSGISRSLQPETTLHHALQGKRWNGFAH